MEDNPPVADASPKPDDPPVLEANPQRLVPIDYASPRPVDVWRSPRAPLPPELRAVALVLCSFMGGACLNVFQHRDDDVGGLLGTWGVLGGILWYVVARMRRRKNMRLVWKVQLVLATLLCMFGALRLTEHVRDFLDRHRTPWYIQHRRLEWGWVLPGGIGWFVAAEIAAAIDWRLQRKSLTPPAAGLPRATSSA
jgi:hypothetical protein